MRLKPLEAELQAPLVEAIRLLGSRNGVGVVWVANQARPPKGVKRGTRRYTAWLESLKRLGFEPGEPDLIVDWPGPGTVKSHGHDEMFVFGPQLSLRIECKRPGEKPTKTQRDRHKALRQRGIPVLVWDDGRVETALEWLRARGCPI